MTETFDFEKTILEPHEDHYYEVWYVDHADVTASKDDLEHTVFMLDIAIDFIYAFIKKN